jgi:hypothetical protein
MAKAKLTYEKSYWDKTLADLEQFEQTGQFILK